MSSYNKPYLRNDSVPPFSLFSKHLDKIENMQSYLKKNTYSNWNIYNTDMGVPLPVYSSSV